MRMPWLICSALTLEIFSKVKPGGEFLLVAMTQRGDLVENSSYLNLRYFRYEFAPIHADHYHQ